MNCTLIRRKKNFKKMDFNSKNAFSMDSTRLVFVCAAITTCFLVGGFGNIASIIIFSNKEFKKQETTNYIKVTLLFSILVLLYAPIMYLAPVWVINRLNCSIYITLVTIITEIKAWIQAIGSLDRLISVLKPQKYHFKNKLIFQISLISSICLIVILLILPGSIFYTTTNIQNFTLCSFDQNTKWVFIYVQIEYFLFRTVFPCFIMIISSCIVSWKMYKNKTLLLPHAEHKREIDFFKSLIAFDLFVLVFQIPSIVQMFSSSNANYFTTIEYSIYFTISLISNMFLFIIFIIFNKIYRKVFCKKFLFLCKRSNRIVPM